MIIRNGNGFSYEGLDIHKNCSLNEEIEIIMEEYCYEEDQIMNWMNYDKISSEDEFSSPFSYTSSNSSFPLYFFYTFILI